jgi:hypothetical protein
MEIKILGPSCVNCLKLELHVAQTLQELGREGKIVKIADEKEISKFSESPPILLIDGQLVHAGLPLPARERIMQWISERG